MEELYIYSDGGARGNPGEAGIGVVISSPDGTVLYEFGGYIGKKTNNQAEYSALIKALEKARDYRPKKARCFLDSELVVKQLNGEYQVRNKVLRPLFQKVLKLQEDFEEIQFSHVPRDNDKIKIADRLVNEAIDARVGA
jgi:ribonuclease HI